MRDGTKEALDKVTGEPIGSDMDLYLKELQTNPNAPSDPFDMSPADTVDASFKERVNEGNREELANFAAGILGQSVADTTGGAPSPEEQMRQAIRPKPKGGAGGSYAPTPAEEFGTGLSRSTAEMVKAGGTGLQILGTAIHSGKTQLAGEHIAKHWAEVAEKFPRSAAAQGKPGHEESFWGDPTRFLSKNWWAATIGESVPVIAASFIPGMAAEKYLEIGGQAMKWSPTLVAKLARIGGAVSGGSVAGALQGANTFEVVKAKGGTEEDAARASALMGLVGTGINALQFGAMFNAKGLGGKVGLGGASGVLQWLQSPTEALVVGNDVIQGWKQGLDAAIAGTVMGAAGGAAAHGLEGGKAPSEAKAGSTNPAADGAVEAPPKRFTPREQPGAVGAAEGATGAAQTEPAAPGVKAPTAEQLSQPVPEGTVLHVNLSRVDASESAKRVMANLEKANAEAMAADRAAKPHEKTIAESAGAMSVEDMIAIQPDQALNRTEMTHLRDTANRQATLVNDMVERVKNGDMEAANDLPEAAALALKLRQADELAGRSTARTLEARKIPSKAERGASLEEIARVAENMRGQIEQDPVLFANRVSRLGSQRQKGQFWRNFARHAAAGQDAFYEAWINAMLSSPTTHAVNAISNSLASFWAVNERALAALPWGSEISVREAPAMFRGLVEGFGDAIRTAGKALGEGATQHGASKLGSRADMPGIRAPERLKNTTIGRAIDLAGEMVRIPGRALITSDEFFYQMNYRMELKAQAMREAQAQGLTGEALSRKIHDIETDPPTEIKEAADRFALMNTFQNELGPWGKAAQELANKTPMGRLVTPFIKTPMNLASYGIQRTPGLQFAHGQFQADLRAGGARAELAKAKIATAAMTAAVVTAMAADGRITGGGPKDPRLRQIWLLDHQPYSFKINDTWYGYNRMDPAFMPFGIIADFTDIAGQIPEANALELANATVLSFARNITSKTQWIGLGNFLDAMSGDETKSRNFIKGLARSTVPAGVRQMTRYGVPVSLPGGAVWTVAPGDHSMHEVRSLHDTVMSSLPGWSNQYPPPRNVFAEPILLTGGLGPDIVSPVYQTPVRHDPVIDEMKRVQVEIPKMPWTMGGSKPQGLVMTEPRPGEGVELTPWQRDRWIVLSGEPLYKRLKTTMASEAYKRSSDGAKALTIQTIVGVLRTAGAAQLLKEDPDLAYKVYQERTLRKVQPLTDTPLTTTRQNPRIAP